MSANSVDQRSAGVIELLAGRLAYALLPFVLIGTLLILLARHWWLADLIANLRVQLVLGLLITAVLFAVARNWWWLAGCVLLLAVHVPSFVSVFAPGDTAEQTGILTVMTVNVLSHNPRHGDIVETIRASDADVVAVLEITSDLAATIETRLGDRYPWRIAEPHDVGNFGIAVYTKLEPLTSRIAYLNDRHLPSVDVTLNSVHGPVRMIATHTFPPMNASGFAHRNQHLKILAREVADFHADGTHVVVLGDMNLTPWSPHFSDFESASGLHRATLNGALKPTWYRFDTFPFGLALDHCLVSEELVCTGYFVGDDIGSDHRAVVAQLALRQRR